MRWLKRSKMRWLDRIRMRWPERLLMVRRMVSRSSRFLCYLLVLSMIHWDQYKIFWRGKSTNSGDVGTSAAKEHLFIYDTFLYDRPPNATNFGKVQLVVLFLARENQRITKDMVCLVTKNMISVKKMALMQEQITSLGVCALDLFVVTCTIDGLRHNDELFREKNQNEYSLVLRGTDREGRKKSAKLTLSPQEPNYKKRGLVMCMSRVFLFERWQMFITAMEAYRHFKVDLVVAHVQSALLSVFELMKAYERQGLLAIRPGIRFPHHMDMPWDPNSETEFNGQILLAHQCFYEFRESAAFIALIDWDDLLVPSSHFTSLPAAFARAAKRYPQAAYFKVNKLEASFEHQATTQSRFSLRTLAEQGIRMAEMYNDEKMVVRPKELRGFWMHFSLFLETGMQPMQLFTNYSIMLHLANEERVNSDEFQIPFLTRFDIGKMNAHATSILEEVGRVHARLPRAHPFYDALVACHSRIFAYYKSTGQGRSRCLSYSLCALPAVRERCMVTRSSFRTLRSHPTGAKSVLHIRRNSRFDKEDCVASAGI